MRHYTTAEVGIHNALGRNMEHVNCPLIMKEAYLERGKIGLYCAIHDHYLKWVSDEELPYLLEHGIKLVEYPFGGTFEDTFDHFSKFKKTVTVTNLLTGKKVKILKSQKGDLYRDPSRSSYWINVNKYMPG
jgi:hypothetical protein